MNYCVPTPNIQMLYHQKKALYFAQKYHKETKEKRKDAYFKLCIRHSIKYEKLDKEEKSF